MRVENWESRLAEQIDLARERPFETGMHDCLTFVLDVRAALTGEAPPPLKGSYSTEREIRLKMLRMGLRSYKDAATSLLGEPLQFPLMGQRGDIVLKYPEEAFGVVVGAHVAFLAPIGLTFEELAADMVVWRV